MACGRPGELAAAPGQNQIHWPKPIGRSLLLRRTHRGLSVYRRLYCHTTTMPFQSLAPQKFVAEDVQKGRRLERVVKRGLEPSRQVSASSVVAVSERINTHALRVEKAVCGHAGVASSGVFLC